MFEVGFRTKSHATLAVRVSVGVGVGVYEVDCGLKTTKTTKNLTTPREIKGE